MSESYKRATERFRCYGIDLNNPVDNVRPGYYPIVENVRSYTDGLVQPRQGLTLINTVSSTNKTPVWTARRLNDPNSGGYRHILQIQDTLSHGTTSTGYTRAQYNAADVALTSEPSIMVPFRPDQAISSWMYLANKTAMYKIIGANPQSITAGTVHKVGVAPPTTAPTVELDVTGGSSWSDDTALPLSGATAASALQVDGTVYTGAVSTVSRIPAGQLVTTAVGAPSADWACVVVPAVVADVCGIGQILGVKIGGVFEDRALVYEIHRASAVLATGVGAILYDTGATGTCTIQPTGSLREIARNAVVRLDSAGVNVYARITDVIYGTDGTLSFRCSTGASTVLVTKSLQIVDSLLLGISDVPQNNDPIQDFVVGGPGSRSYSVGGIGTASTKTGWIQTVPVTPFDLTQPLSVSVAYRSFATDDSLISLGFLMSDLSNLVQGRIMFDCDNASLAITSTSLATPTVVTTTLIHQLASGDCVYISGAADAACNGTFYVTVTGTSTFTLFTDQARTIAVIGAGGGAAGTAKPLFKKNFYYRAFTPNDLITAVKGTQTALTNSQTQVTNQIIGAPRRPNTGARNRRDRDEQDRPDREFPALDPNAPRQPGPVRTQTGLGDYTWCELQFRRSDLVPVGPIATNKGNLSSLRALRIETTLNSTTAITMIVNSLTLWGVSSQLEVSDLAAPYIYRYRYRVSSTGAASNWSPASRTGINTVRDVVTITCATTSAPEVDLIDIQRLGGVNTTWLTVGSIKNTGTPVFSDTVSDVAAAAAAPVSDLDTNFQLWPVLAKPASNLSPTTTTTVGPFLKDTNAPFNQSWAKGTPIKVAGKDTQIRRVVSTSIIELDDSFAALTNPTWEIPQPTLIGQPLPALWEWNSRGFGCGDLNNPGYLYWTNGNSLDTTQDTNYIEVTPPSEPLVMGCSFNGKNYVWSSERMFEIWQSGLGDFQAIEIPGRKGLFCRWALCTGEKIWYLSRDGIYQTGGGDSISITDETLRPLFTIEGGAGTAVNGFNPPDFSQTTKLRLSYYKGYLYFTYQDTGGAVRTLVYTVRAEKPGWWPDTYLDGRGITTFYGEEGDGVNSLLACGNDVTTAKLYQSSGTSDNTGPIPCHVRTQYFDAQDRRAEKRWGDLIIDADPNNTTITPVVYTNGSTSGSLTLSPTTFTGAARTQQIIEVSTGSDPVADHSRNAALDVTWSSTGATPKLYFWEPSYIIRPEQTDMRATDWDDLGVPQDKFIQGLEIDANTFGNTKSITVEYDGLPTNIGETLSATHNGRKIIAYSFHPPFIGHTVRLHSTDAVNWAFYSAKWYFQSEAPKADHWESQQCSFGGGDFVHLKAMYATIMSTQNVTLTVTRTEDGHADTYTIPSSSGLRIRQYVPFVASKGKLYTFTFSSTGVGGQFRLYRPETNVLVKEWASETQYAGHSVFGGESGEGKVGI